MKKTTQLFVITEQQTWQFRTAQCVDNSFAAALRRLCLVNTPICSCFLLDARQSDGADVKFVIALLLEDEQRDFGQIGFQVQAMLRMFPSIAERTAIMSAKPFVKDYAGTEFYVRPASLTDLTHN